MVSRGRFDAGFGDDSTGGGGSETETGESAVFAAALAFGVDLVFRFGRGIMVYRNKSTKTAFGLSTGT